MAPHPSTLVWKTPWMEEPGALQPMGSLGVEMQFTRPGFSANQSQVLNQEALHHQGAASLANPLLEMGSDKAHHGLQIPAGEGKRN